MEFIVSKDGKTFTIKGELAQNPEISKSGKSLVLASTNGNKPVAHAIGGENIVFGLNVYIPATAKASAAFAKPAEK